MTNVSEWSISAGNNDGAPPDGWPEFMLPGKVNDCAREMMAALARWYQDSNASLETTGGTTAYNLATNSVYAAPSDIPLLTFKLHITNTGAVTLNVDGLGAKPLRKSGSLEDYAAGELTTGQTMVVTYNSDTNDFETIGPTAHSEFDSGTEMLFAQTSAPTGWTKGLAHNNKALRVVTGTASSGGSTSFTGVFTSRTIALANLPAASLSHSLTAETHTHGSGSYAVDTSISNGSNVARSPTTNNNSQSGGGSNIVNTVNTSTLSLGDGDVTGSSSASGALAVAGTVSLGGSGTAVDFAVQYVDVILATKA